MTTSFHTNRPIVVDSEMPAQSPATNGKALISNGVTASWNTVLGMVGTNAGQVTPTQFLSTVLPVQAGNAGKALVTDGSVTSWSSIVGPAGANGAQGPVGYTGSAGATGAIGYTGSASTVAGPAGSQGPIGYTGSASATSLGVGQVWSHPSRTNGTVYTNTTGRPIMVNVLGVGGNFTGASIAVQIGGVYTTIAINQSGSSGYDTTVSAIIPDQTSYIISGASAVFELS